MDRVLFKHIDNSPLILFRIAFGLLIAIEGFGGIATGWVKRTLIEPSHTFTFIGFDWLQPLPGNGMLYYYAVMGILGIFVMIGFKYRYSMLAFTIMWTATYLMQKTSYNNHYYLLILLSSFMVIVPAHRYMSVDAKLNPSIKSNSMPQWCVVIFILQMFIVYSYAAVAKIYPDWLNASVPEMLMRARKDYWLVGGFLQQHWVHYAIAYFGIMFDAFIIPLLLFKKTRIWGFLAGVFFHLFNSFIFHIGIFPYMSIALCVFFFHPKTIQSIFFKRKDYYDAGEVIIPNGKNLAITLFSIYFIVQICLPLRHWFIKDDVLWTEEGHRLSWRMMLRSRSGNTTYRVVDKATDLNIPFKMTDFLTDKQIKPASSKPDMIWQFAQRLKKHYAEEGKDVKVYVNSFVGLNGEKKQRMIDPTVDLASVPWDFFEHSSWILPKKIE
ncbi:Vitamin K-dependent gamma-carboxylase [Flavobacteriaceae bacterium MAR_2010_188]|nr:Vitamin K-dependent gamma-carboxylase [Flavobacteriaceae bacterium MAR_2010_188]